jgi:hypothetical protein
MKPHNQCFDLAYKHAIKILEEEYGSGLEYITRHWSPTRDMCDPELYALDNADFEDCIAIVADELYDELEDYLLSLEEAQIEEDPEDSGDCPNPHMSCSDCGMCMD